MCCHEMNHLHAIIRYHFFDFDVCVVIFNVSYIESFYEKYSMFGKSKILCMSFSVIETYDQKYWVCVCHRGSYVCFSIPKGNPRARLVTVGSKALDDVLLPINGQLFNLLSFESFFQSRAIFIQIFFPSHPMS